IATLLDNTLQHAGDGAAVSIDASVSANSVTITVADNGRGIPPDIRHSVFEPFFTTARAEGGTGLGLSIVQAIASAAGGSIRLLDMGPGAAFSPSLPLGK